MTTTAIVGAGYTGLRLIEALRSAGHAVRATTTTPDKAAAIEAAGASPHVVTLDDSEGLRAALAGATRIVHLAPPDRQAEIGPQVERLVGALPDTLETFVYGSTTGAFGRPADPEAWIDEATAPHEVSGWGRMRLDYEIALRDAGVPLKVVRIAGIYGPGRTLARRLDDMVLFEDGPLTSRIHVDDLVRLLAAMTAPDAPGLAVGCDAEPAETLAVARYTAELLGRALPRVLSRAEAETEMSPQAKQMRLQGRRCRSRVFESLVGERRYPTYREGVKASLQQDGLLRGDA